MSCSIAPKDHPYLTYFACARAWSIRATLDALSSIGSIARLLHTPNMFVRRSSIAAATHGHRAAAASLAGAVAAVITAANLATANAIPVATV